MEASFKNERKKEQQVLLPCIEFPGFKKTTLELVRKSEKGSSRTTVTIYQLWKTIAVTNKYTNRCPKVINGINGNNLIDNNKLSW